MTGAGNPVAAYQAAARSFAQLLRQIPDDRWDGPGLGEWDLRALVGHTARSLITVINYLSTTAAREDISTPAEYYVRIREIARSVEAVERGRQAGIEMGADPAGAVDALVDRALADLAGTDDRLIQVIGGLGMRLHAYLPTRTFELTVHSLDIAAAVGIPFTPPPDAIEQATVLAARVAVAVGQGAPVLTALTGRTALAPGFSVV